MVYIYAYENKIDGKVYIGQAEDLKERDTQHVKYPNETMYIDRAIKCHGRENFDLWTIELPIMTI